MRRTKVLIISSKEDAHTDFIIDKLNKAGLADKVIRFNTEDFIENCSLTYTKNNSCLQFRDSNKSIDSNELLTVWYRRPKEINVPSQLSKYSHFIKEQTDAVLKGFYFATHFCAKWINPLDSLYRARLKVQQLELAKRLGFKLPDTIITNSANELLNFIDSYPKISTKSLDYPNAKVDGELFPLYNRVIDKESFKMNVQSAAYCPTIFQEYIEKKYDIRVIVIGRKLTAFAIYSQEHSSSIEDVRGMSPFNLKHEIIELPDTLRMKIMEFMRQQNLIFSAIDLVYGVDKEYYFLENNPNGQWLWLEEKTGCLLSEIFIAELYSLQITT